MQQPSIAVGSARVARMLALLVGVAAGGCGDSGSAGSDAGTTSVDGSETEGTTAEASTGEETTTTGSSTTEEPILLCDGSTVENLFDCEPCTECGSWDRDSIGTSLPPAVQCTLEGIVNGERVSSTQMDCNLGMCNEDRFATTLDGTMYDQLRLLDMNNAPTNYLATVEWSLRELAYFESCLVTTDPDEILQCASPNTWFVESVGEPEPLVCP